jgi:hypothetical protein
LLPTLTMTLLLLLLLQPLLPAATATSVNAKCENPIVRSYFISLETVSLLNTQHTLTQTHCHGRLQRRA